MKIKKRKSRQSVVFLIIAEIFLLVVILVGTNNLFSNNKPKDPVINSPTPLIDASDVKKGAVTSTPMEYAKNTEMLSSQLIPNLASQNAILICLEDQQILLDKDSEATIYPASLTKIMTALVAIENLEDLNQSILLPSEMFDALYEENASMAGFLPDETVTALDLLYGVLLPSGAECCIGLANYISGSEESFVTMMNDKAEALDMKNTHFTNSTGLHNKEHYSTVKDLALLLEYALQNASFREIFTATRHSTGATKLHPDGITFNSTLFKNMMCPDFNGGSILGGKTGYTSKAGLCLASLAIKDNKEYILVTAGANGNHSTEPFHILDAIYVYSSLK